MDKVVCKTGKIPLTRKKAAESAKWWRLRRYANMSSYKCKYCGYFHIGNQRRRRKK